MLSFLSQTFPMNAEELLMINIKYSWSFHAVLFEILGNAFLVRGGTTLFSMFFLGLRSPQMYFSVLYVWKPLCSFHQTQQTI